MNMPDFLIAPLHKVLLGALLWLPLSTAWAQEEMSPKETEDWSRKPPIVDPYAQQHAPSDAIILFRGKDDLRHWEHLDGSPVTWDVQGEELLVTPKATDIQTKQKFGDCQLHVEWRTPDPKEDFSNNMGNSGVFLMGLYELQIYESYHDENKIYYNGQAGSVYKQHIPLVNASLPPRTWQSYDIVFEAPEFNADKSLKTPAYLTVFQNSVLILNHVALKGPMKYQGLPEYEYHASKLPLRLQEHNSRVGYRNLWIREL
ncbi:protein of unknown function [Catalinimonas alkaloidigena]|uniref:3-keto-alpha-glucoside-1,2-lyase/3-keto-2-hydroxy-glucal hydratase domain-containing protein n=2 Tax=Catalinimonas alkaloidigena TaxID=1075417 RepID=A0A1G9QH89_9BACT|nr:protein of unknown function [Catalinimonas alkaloidigena]